jgi:glutamyl-tRNA reductase
MNLLLIGLNHKTATVDLRERFAISGQKLDEGVAVLKSMPEVKEVAVLSTCNRVELYLSVNSVPAVPEQIKEFLSRFHAIERKEFEKALYIRSGVDAMRHVMRVAASLDSMVVGEPQILGQLKDAFDFALSKKSTGIVLNTLMKKAISAAKRVRTETRIAENAVSISFAAVELAKKIFTDLSEKAFMLLGAGDMAELAARHLVNNGVTRVLVCNRTFERGCDLAREFCGRAVRFEDFMHELAHVDIIICSTGAPTYVLRKEQMHRVMKERKHRPVFIIDISVPRNIDPEINRLDNVYLYDIDDLQGVVDANISERQREAEKAEQIIDEEVEKFARWVSSLDTVPTIVALRQKAEDIKKEELLKFRHRFPDMNDTQMKAVEQLTAAIVNKLIHPPTAALKDDREDRELLTATIKRLYGIDGEEEK